MNPSNSEDIPIVQAEPGASCEPGPSREPAPWCEAVPALLLERRRRWLRPGRLVGRTGGYALATLFGLLIAGGGGYALASSSSTTIHGCVSNRTGALSVRARCERGTRALVWGKQGPQGKPGTTTTITRLAPAGWTVDFVSAPALSSGSDPGLAFDSRGISSLRAVQNGEDEVVATGCHDQAPTVVANADPNPGHSGSAAEASVLVPSDSGTSFEPVNDARPDSHGDETFDVFTYVPDSSANNTIAGGYITDADQSGNNFTLLIYC